MLLKVLQPTAHRHETICWLEASNRQQGAFLRSFVNNDQNDWDEDETIRQTDPVFKDPFKEISDQGLSCRIKQDNRTVEVYIID